MRSQFRDTIMDLSKTDPSITLLFGDVSVYLFREFQELYPDRFYNLGICENTIISAAAGMAAQGLTPFAHTIAPFLTERSLEQIKLDLSYNRFAANIVTCGASFDYAWDGATHHCLTDLAILRLLPGMEVVQPGSRAELDVLLRQSYNDGNPTYYRLSDRPHQVQTDVAFGKGCVVKDGGAKTTVVTAGPILGNVVEACADLPVNVLYFPTIKPLDYELLDRYKDTEIIVVHDAFGLHEAVNVMPGLNTRYHGLKDAYCACYGTLEDIRETLDLDVKSLREVIGKAAA
jgi:transketolase